jgi:hypothetical protein
MVFPTPHAPDVVAREEKSFSALLSDVIFVATLRAPDGETHDSNQGSERRHLCRLSQTQIRKKKCMRDDLTVGGISVSCVTHQALRSNTTPFNECLAAQLAGYSTNDVPDPPYSDFETA